MGKMRELKKTYLGEKKKRKEMDGQLIIKQMIKTTQS